MGPPSPIVGSTFTGKKGGGKQIQEIRTEPGNLEFWKAARGGRGRQATERQSHTPG